MVDLGQRWNFGFNTEVAEEQGVDGWYFRFYASTADDFIVIDAEFADGVWVPANEYAYGGVICNVYGYVNAGTIEIDGETYMLNVQLLWEAPFAGLFAINGHAMGDNAVVTVHSLGGGEDFLAEIATLVEDGYAFELMFEVEAEAGQTVVFGVVSRDGVPATTNWNISISEVEAFDLNDENDNENDNENENENENDNDEEPAPAEVCPLDDVAVWVSAGVEFVAVREAAYAFGYTELSWDSETMVITIYGLENGAFDIVAVGGFFDAENWRNYIPVEFAAELFGC